MQAGSPSDAPDTSAPFDPRSGHLLERAVFNHRLAVMLACAVVTVLLAVLAATKLGLSASFEKMIPRSHPYIQNYLDNRVEPGGGSEARRERDGSAGSSRSARKMAILKPQRSSQNKLPI